jgi:hypothetical protein
MLPASSDSSQSPTARAAALIAATQEANARRLAEAQARAAAILAEAERANAAFLTLAEEQATLLLGSLTVENTAQPAGSEAAPQSSGGEERPLVRIHPELGDEPPSLASIDGGVDLIAGPFARFSELAAFTRAVRGLQGITSLDTREFLKGTVHLRLRYEDPIQLSVRLTELSEFRPFITQVTPSRVELRVNLADPAAQTEEPVEDAA